MLDLSVYVIVLFVTMNQVDKSNLEDPDSLEALTHFLTCGNT